MSQLQKRLPKWRQRFVKYGLKKTFFFVLFFFFFEFFFLVFFFLSKSTKFRVVWTRQFCSNFTSMWPQTFLKECMEGFQTSEVSISNGSRLAGKSFNGKFTAKIDFWWNLNKIVWSELYKILNFLTKKKKKKKNLTIFDNVLTPFLEDVSVTETIVWC